jgi:hypothetical protein
VVFNRDVVRKTLFLAERPQREDRVNRILLLRPPARAHADPRIELAARDDARHGVLAPHRAKQRHRALGGTPIDRDEMLSRLLVAKMAERA